MKKRRPAPSIVECPECGQPIIVRGGEEICRDCNRDDDDDGRFDNATRAYEGE